MSNDSRINNTSRNAFYGICSQIIVLILNFANRTIFIKILGSEYLGISGLFSDILTMLSMADLGFGTAMAYSFYKPLAQNDYHVISGLIHFYKKIYNTIAVVVAIIGLLLLPFIGYLLNLEQPIPGIHLFYLFFLCNTVVSYLFVYKSSIINADQKSHLIVKYNIFTNCLRTFSQAISLILLHNYFVYLGINVLFTFINNLLISRKTNKLYPFIKEKPTQIAHEQKKDIFDNMKSVFLYKVSGVLLNGTDNILISVIVGTVWVGVYSNYIMIVNILNSFITTIYGAATASIGNLIVKETADKKFETFRIMQFFSCMITSFITICLYTMLNDLVYIWLGNNFVFDYITLTAIILNFYIGGILQPVWSFREATGLYRKIKYIMVIAAIVNVILSIILGIWIGVAGILFASAISRITTYFWYEPKLLFGEYFKKGVKQYYIPILFNFIVTIVLCGVFGYISSFFIVHSWGDLFIKGGITVVIAAMLIVLVYIKNSNFAFFVKKISDILTSQKSNRHDS